MDVRPEPLAEQGEEEVLEARERSGDEGVTRIAREQHAARLSGGEPEQARAGRRAAHDPAEDDDVGGPDRVGRRQQVGEDEGGPFVDLDRPRELRRGGLVPRDDLDHGSRGGASAEQLGLHLPDPAADLGDRGAVETVLLCPCGDQLRVVAAEPLAEVAA